MKDATIPDYEYEHKEYPKFRHHPTNDSVRVGNPDEEADLTPSSAGWTDSLAEAQAAREAAAQKKAKPAADKKATE